VSLESRARAPLGLNDSRDYPELLEQAAEIPLVDFPAWSGWLGR
jgi:hypothetical protein